MSQLSNRPTASSLNRTGRRLAAYPGPLAEEMARPTIDNRIQLQQHQSLMELVDSPAWERMQQIKAEILNDHQTQIPSGLEHIVGYFTNKVVADALNLFMNRIEQEAEDA